VKVSALPHPPRPAGLVTGRPPHTGGMPVLPAAAFLGSSGGNPFDTCGLRTAAASVGPQGSTQVGSFSGGNTLCGAGFGSTPFGGTTGLGLGEKSRRRPTAAEFLVRDRFSDFERMARQMNTLPEVGSSTSPEKTPADVKKDKGFMREFFQAINEIQGVINGGKQKVKLMGEVLEDALMATTQDRQREVSDRLQQLVEDTNRHIALAKSGIEHLKQRSDAEDAKKPNSAEGKIRQNMQQAVAKKHQQLLLDFQKAQVDYKKALERRQLKDMEILMPDASEEERAEMIEAGETTSLAVTMKMAGAHALLLDEVQRIREKHQDILRLEASIADLAQMFQEMAVLVESQGEMLDAIELNVHRTKGATAKAEVQLIKTRKEQHKYSKYMCCLTVTLMIVVLVVVGPVLLKNGG